MLSFISFARHPRVSPAYEHAQLKADSSVLHTSRRFTRSPLTPSLFGVLHTPISSARHPAHHHSKAASQFVTIARRVKLNLSYIVKRTHNKLRSTARGFNHCSVLGVFVCSISHDKKDERKKHYTQNIHTALFV